MLTDSVSVFCSWSLEGYKMYRAVSGGIQYSLLNNKGLMVDSEG